MKYVLFSDIHANDIALYKVVAYVENLLKDQGEYRYLFLGDLVGYGTTTGALKCIRWLRSHSDIDWIPGNHDEWMAHQGNLSFQGSAVISLMIQKAFLSHPEYQDDLSWFQRQVISIIEKQPILSFEQDGLALYFAHACVENGLERVPYLYPWIKSRIKLNSLELRKKSPQKHISLFLGHTHYPMLACLQDKMPVYASIYYGQPISLCGGVVIANPGSVGQPRDGDPRSSFAVLDTEKRTITFHRVEYNIKEMEMGLEADGHFGSSFHVLTWEERDAVMDELKRTKKKIDTAELRLLSREQQGAKAKQESKIINAQETYEELITRLWAGNNDANLSLYRGIYRKVEGGLEAIK